MSTVSKDSTQVLGMCCGLLCVCVFFYFISFFPHSGKYKLLHTNISDFQPAGDTLVSFLCFTGLSVSVVFKKKKNMFTEQNGSS